MSTQFVFIGFPTYKLSKTSAPEPLCWENKFEQALIRLKQAVQELPVLRLPNYSTLFTLFVHERDNQVLEVLTQEHANKHRPIAFYSTQLDLVAQCAYLNCLKAIVAAANLVEASADLTLGNDIYLQAPHAVQS